MRVRGLQVLLFLVGVELQCYVTLPQAGVFYDSLKLATDPAHDVDEEDAVWSGQVDDFQQNLVWQPTEFAPLKSVDLLILNLIKCVTVSRSSLC